MNLLNYSRQSPLKLATLWAGFLTLACLAQNVMPVGELPLGFEAVSPALFRAQGNGAQLIVSQGGVRLRLRGQPDAPPHSLQMGFVNASQNARIVGQEELPGKINYFTGDNPAQWRSGVPLYAKVRVEELYPGISAAYYGNQQRIEYDLTVAAGANPASIVLDFSGVDTLRVGADGELILKLGGRRIIQPKPLVYQVADGKRQTIPGGYKILNSHRVAFAIGQYDHARALVIDPVLSYATYFGGTSGEAAWGVALNPDDGSIYIAGQTFSKRFYTNGWSFSTPGAFQTNYAGGDLTGDAFVARFDNLGKNLIYLTYLGGSGNDGALGVAVDGAGNAFVTGWTDSTNFPTTTNAFSRRIAGSLVNGFTTYPVDAFVAKLSPDGSRLVYSTYLGGSRMDTGTGITVDAADNAYVTGYTYSTNFPTQNAYQDHLACQYSQYFNCNAFVSEIASNGSALVFSTYLGGTNFDQGTGIGLDAANDIYVVGHTTSTNFPTTNYIYQVIGTNLYDGHYLNGFKQTTGDFFAKDAFVAKFAPSGSNLIYSTYLGGKDGDDAYHVAVDSGGAAYVTGWTVSTNFPATVTTNVIMNRLFRNVGGDEVTNAFLTKITNAIGAPAGIEYSVPFGGGRSAIGYGVAVDPAGDAFVVGATSATNFPCFPTNSTGYLRSTNAGGRDVFVTVFNPDASAVIYSVLMGGAQRDEGTAIAVDPAGNAYVAGQTYSTNFATPGAFQTFRNGTNDTFLAKILMSSQPTLSISSSGGTNVAIAWPGFAPEFVLESSTNLASTNWLAVPQSPTLTNGWTTVNLPATNDVSYFRLDLN